MNLRKLAAVLGAAAIAAGVLGACGKEGSPEAEEPGTLNENCLFSGVEFPAASGVDVAGSPTFAKAKARGKLIVGIKRDQPNLGYEDVNKKRCGFDIETAWYLASKLGFDPKTQIEYQVIPSADRETALKAGTIDYYVGTYSITDKRKADVAFAGPYFIAGQDLLVRKDETKINGPDDLKGRKVCSVTGSTPIQRIREKKYTEDSNIVEFKEYSQCVSQLLDKKVDAVTTDDAILRGYAAQGPKLMKVVGKPFSTEKYGIGLPRDDKALRDAMNNALEAMVKDGIWKKVYDGTLGKSGSSAEPPPLERY